MNSLYFWCNIKINKTHYQQEINFQSQLIKSKEKIPGKFFVIKSIDEANILRSINFKIWCSTIKGNQKLQKAFKESEKKYPIYLFFSVNGSGKFMGLAQMASEVEYRVNFNYLSLILDIHVSEAFSDYIYIVITTI